MYLQSQENKKAYLSFFFSTRKRKDQLTESSLNEHYIQNSKQNEKILDNSKTEKNTIKDYLGI